MTMEHFALSLIESFDLDITQHCIIDSKYLSTSCGLNVIEVFYNNDLVMELPALKNVEAANDRTALISHTLDRAERYVGR